MSSLRPFHIAFPVNDLAAARHFYGSVLGCPEGRSSEQWIDFDFFGHQIVAHHKPLAPAAEAAHSNAVDGHDVPVPHFGVVLTPGDWKALAERVRAAGVRFVIEPYTRFEGRSASSRRCFSWTPPATHWSSRLLVTWSSCSRSKAQVRTQPSSANRNERGQDLQCLTLLSINTEWNGESGRLPVQASWTDARVPRRQ